MSRDMTGYRGLEIHPSGGDSEDHRFVVSIGTELEPERCLMGDDVQEMMDKIDRYLDARVDMCEDEGCPRFGTPHVCLTLTKSSSGTEMTYTRAPTDSRD